MSTQQKALLVPAKFADFVVGSKSIPKPGPGELLVKIRSTALNPFDWKVHKYGIFVEEFPAVLGSDLAGDVEEVGEGVTTFVKGDRVFAQGQYQSDWATFQQYAKTNAATTSKIPSKFSYDDVATIPVALSAAYVGLYGSNPGAAFDAPVSASAVGKYANTPLIVLGGSSSVGRYVIQLAKYSGFYPIITTSSLKHADEVKSLGATHVIDRNTSVVAEVRKLTDKPILTVYDAISSADTQQAGIDVLAAGGKLVIVLPPSVKAEGKEIIHIMGLASLHPELLTSLYGKDVYGFLEQGVLKPSHLEIVGGLAAIPEGLNRLQNNQVSNKKLVAHPQD
jgi:NADPH:quinone reductase-like Zn-dependent oxidoreductase